MVTRSSSGQSDPRSMRRGPWVLWFGVAAPLTYFGIQIAAAPFYPGFSWVRTTASDLGASTLPYHRVFNFGVLALAAALAIAAAGFLAGLRRRGVQTWHAALVALALLGMSAQTAWAAWFPQPDPRHGGHPMFVMAMLATPILITLALWRRVSLGMRVYFALNLAVLAAMVPIMSGLIAVDRAGYAGLLQRVLTATVFGPIAIGAFWLRRGAASPRS